MQHPGAEPTPSSPLPAATRVSRNVVALGLVSLLQDLSGDMVYPLVPIFLTAVLGAPVAAVGLIEGVAESLASLMKLASGLWSDRVRRRLPLVAGGYSLAVIGKLLLAAAGAWPVVFAARLVDRFGKGIRGSARDALIADSTVPDLRGRAFGLHRAMESAGAVLGPLAGLALVAALPDRLRLIFLIAAAPGFAAVLTLAAVREPRATRAAAAPPALRDGLRALDRRLLLFFVAVALFGLGNSSDVFLLLRARSIGFSTQATVLAYVVYNFVYMGAAFPAGTLSDRVGRSRVYVGGLLVFACVYAGFAVAGAAPWLWAFFAVYGLYLALTDSIGRAFVSDLAPVAQRASLLGLFGLLTGLSTLVANVLAGLLWDVVGIAAPFALGASCALAAAVVLAVIPARSPAAP